MSLQFNATSDQAIRSTSISGTDFTFIVQFKPESNPTGWVCAVYNTGGSGQHSGFRTWYTGGVIRCEGALYGSTGSYSAGQEFTNDSWHQVAIVQNNSGGTMDAYLWSPAGARQLIYSRSTAGFTATGIFLGAPDQSREGQSNSTFGCFRYAKYWSNTILSASELDTERTSATCVKAGGTSLWALPDATTGTDSINGYDFTITSGSTSASEPGYIGAGGSVAPIAAYYQSLRANE